MSADAGAARGSAQVPIEYADASPEVRAVYDDIMATRKSDWVNNYWKVLAHHPPTLRRMWANSKEVMGPGALDPLTKELIYMAVSVTNACRYCIASHGAAARKEGNDARAARRTRRHHRARERDQSSRRRARFADR